MIKPKIDMINQDNQNEEVYLRKIELEKALESIRNFQTQFLETDLDDLNKLSDSQIKSSEDDEYPTLEEFSLIPKLQFLGIILGVSSLFVLIGLILSFSNNKTTQQITISPPSQTSSSTSLPSPIPSESFITPAIAPTTGDLVCASDSLLGKRISNWAKPTVVTLSKNIIIASGHNGLNDIHKPDEPVLNVKYDGTNGIDNKPVVYQGSSMSLEAAINLRTVSIIQALLEKYGFNVTFVRALPKENLRSKMERIKAMIADNDTFAFEIHYDDPIGNSKQSGSGVIPPNIDPTLTSQSTYADVATPQNLTREGISGYDIALANAFGAYPQDWRNGLGGPRRGVTLLEIDKITKIEPLFRAALTTGHYEQVDKLLNIYATKIANVFKNAYGVGKNPSPKDTFSICSSKLNQ